MEDRKKFNLTYVFSYPLTVCFSAFILLIFVLGFIAPDKELSEWENRYLAQKPGIRVNDVLDGTFMSDYEEYVNDQMPFRDGFIKMKAVAEAAFLKVENNGIARGKYGYLFTKDMGNTDKFDKNIAIISQFADSVENDVTVAIAPNACGVLVDKIPVGFMTVNQKEKLNRLYEDNSLLKGARVVDLNCVLSAHEDEYIYYKTDHHWTTTGAYYAYCAISENPFNIDGSDVSVKDGFYGTLYAKYKGLFVESDNIFYYDIPVKSYTTDGTEREGLYDLDKLSVFDKYGMFMWGNFGRCDIHTNTENGKSVIIFKDSYANCLIPFLTYDYEYITVIDLRYYGDSVKELTDSNRGSDILFINNFDFLNEDNHFYKLLK